MTNAGDFRQYSYANDANYALKAFNVQRQHREVETPAKTRLVDKLVVHENKGFKSASQLKKEQKLAFQKMCKVVAISLACLAFVACVISTFAVKNELTRELSRTQRQIANAQNECISLKSQLNSMVSMSMIEQYAVDELGMSKVKPNQVLYIDVDQYKADRQAMLAQQDEEIANSNKTE